MVLSLVLLLAMSLMGGALIVISSGDHQVITIAINTNKLFTQQRWHCCRWKIYIKRKSWSLGLEVKYERHIKCEFTRKAHCSLLGEMITKNYNPGSKYKFTNTKDRKFIDTKDLCFKSFRDIDRDNPKKKIDLELFTVLKQKLK